MRSKFLSVATIATLLTTAVSVARPDIAAAVTVTERVSVTSAGAQSTGGAVDRIVMSTDGRYVAFESTATNLVTGDTNSVGDIFVRDRQTATTTRVSLAADGSQGNGASTLPSISSDGRYVAFQSTATNLVSGDTNGVADVFVRDLQVGITIRASVAGDGTQSNGASDQAAISGNGRVVAFRSSATNLAPNEIYSWSDIFVRDLDAATTERASVTDGGVNPNGNSQLPSISSDGRFVAFDTYAFNINGQYGDTNSARDVYRRDRLSGTSVRVSLPATGEGNGDSSAAAISANGRYVAFESVATNLVSSDTNAVKDVFLRDVNAATTNRMSVSSAGAQANNLSEQAAISSSGRAIGFRTLATNLFTGDTNNQSDVVVRDRYLGLTSNSSITSTGGQANSASGRPALSSDGRYVAFRSVGTNVVAADTNGQADAFVRDRDQLATPDLELSVSDTPDPTQLGSATTVSFSVRNIGGAGATQVSLAITLAPGTTFVSATAGCVQSGGAVTCSVGSVAPGATSSRDVTVVAAGAGPFVTSAAVTADETEASTANNAISETSTVVQPDLSLAAATDGSPVVVGEVGSVTFTTENLGVGIAPGTQLDLVLDAPGVATVTPSQGTCSSDVQSVQCSLGDLAAGANATVTVEVVPQDAGTVSVSGSVTTTGVDADAGNDAASVSLTAVQPDLAIAVTDLADPVARFAQLDYELVVTNNGDGVARSVTVNDPLPPSTDFVGATTTAGSCELSVGALSCDVGDLAPGGAVTILLSVTPQAIGPVDNTASAATSGPDPNLADNTGSVTTTITNEPEPNLRVSVSDNSDPVRVSESLELQVLVDNLGTATANDTTLVVDLPTAFVDATSTQGTCTPGATTLTCVIGTLAPGGATVIDITLDPDTEALVTTTATATATEPDFDPSDNTASETTLIGEPRLSVTLGAAPDPTDFGAASTATATVTNYGTAPATAVELALTTPAGVVQSLAASAGSCSTEPAVCAIGGLEPGGTASIDLGFVAATVGLQTFVVDVAAAESEADLADNLASASLTVVAPDLVVTATDSPDPVDLGGSVTVTATVANEGTALSPAVGVVVPVPTPGVVSSAIASSGACAVEVDGSASCALGDLAPGASVEVVIVVTPSAKGTLATGVIASTPALQADETDDATIVTTLVRAPDLVVTVTDSVDPRAVGQNIWYTTTARNDGDVAANSVQLAMALPTGTTLVSAYWAGGSCPSNGIEAVCAIGTVAPGQTVSATLGVVASAEGTVSTTSTATSANVDANVANNVESETTRITLLSEFPDNTYQTNGKVDAIAYSGNVVYLAGTFTSVRPKGAALGSNEVARNNLAAFDVTTGAVLPWNPAPNGLVNAIAVSDDGSTVYVGGQFTAIGGQTRYRLAALSAVTGTPTTWNPAPDGEVRSLALAPGGATIYAGGFFGIVAGQPRTKLAAISTATGAVVAGWDPVFTYPNKENLNNVAALAVAPDGSALYAGGLFQYVDGVFHNSIVKLDTATGTVIDPWNPGLEVKSNRFETNVYEVVVHDTKLFICGDWYRVGGVISPNLAAIDTVTGSKRTDWIATTDGAVNACTVSGRRLYIGGHFDRAGGANADGRNNPSPTGSPRQHIAALDLIDGALDGWNPGADSVEGVYALDATATKLGVGGTFLKIGNWTAQQGFAQFNGVP